MTQTIRESIEIVGDDNSLRIYLSNEGEIVVKGPLDKSVAVIRPGIIQLNDANDKMRFVIGKDGVIYLNNDAGAEVLRLLPDAQDTHGSGLRLIMSRQTLSGKTERTILINGDAANIRLGGGGADGDILLFPGSATNTDDNSQATIHLDGDGGNLWLGGNETDGDIVLKNTDGKHRIRLDGGEGNLWLGGNGTDGDLVLFPSGGDNATLDQSTIHLDGDGGNLWLGGNETDGDIVLKNTDGDSRIRLDAGGGNLWVGGNGTDGDLMLFASDGDNNTADEATIHLDGDKGEIRIKNWQISVPDYVFDEAYELKPIEELCQHLHNYGHLPGIPSADEVKSEGVGLGEFSMKLLEKIEELTLYLIEQDKRVEQLQHRIVELEVRNGQAMPNAGLS